MDAALGLLGAVAVVHADEPSLTFVTVCHPFLDVDRDGRVRIAQRRVAGVVERVVWHLVVTEVEPAVFKRPEGEWVELAAFPDMEVASFCAVVPSSAVDPAVCRVFGERTAHRLFLAELVEPGNVDQLASLFVKEVGLSRLFKNLLGGDVLGVVDERFEAVVGFDLVEKGDGLREERVGVDENNLHLVEHASLVERVQNDDIAGNQRNGEDDLLLLCDGFLQAFGDLCSEGGDTLGFDGLVGGNVFSRLAVRVVFHLWERDGLEVTREVLQGCLEKKDSRVEGGGGRERQELLEVGKGK